MPFGSESTGDDAEAVEVHRRDESSPMPFGSESTGDRPDVFVSRRADMASPMPFGSESTGDDILDGLSRIMVESHQCLSAVSPLGTCIRV